MSAVGRMQRSHVGPARTGITTWRQQRLGAVLLLALLLWLAVALASLPALRPHDLLAWFQEDLHAIPIAALLVVMAQHSYLGSRVIAEDYLSHPLVRRAFLVVALCAHGILCAVGLLAVIRLSLGMST